MFYEFLRFTGFPRIWPDSRRFWLSLALSLAPFSTVGGHLGSVENREVSMKNDASRDATRINVPGDRLDFKPHRLPAVQTVYQSGVGTLDRFPKR
jgi:hypothetical protein